jgi:SNF2 family DNA or RNA helicase
MSTLSTIRKKASVYWKPHKYQLKVVKWMLQKGAAFILLDPGLGKTSISLAVVKVLLQQKIIGKVLIIAPLRVCQLVWPAELQKWTDFNDLSMVLLHGPEKDARLRSPHNIAVINPDGLEWLFKATITAKEVRDHEGNLKVKKTVNIDKKWVKSLGYDTLIVDESTMFKRVTSQRYKLLKDALSYFQRRYCLTGTPASNGLMDLFGQVFILDQGGILGRSLTRYKSMFFDSGGYGGYSFTPKLGSEEHIYELLRPLAIRMDAKDYLELPQLVTTPETDIFVELPPVARKRYDEMEDYFLTTLLDGSVVTAFNAAVKSGKLRQIAAGGMFKQHDSMGRPVVNAGWEHLHEVKIDALEELHDSLAGRPMLIGLEFQHDVDRLRRRFGKDFPVINGETKEKTVKEYEELWNRGRLPMLAGHPKSIGHGLNLQECANIVVWLTPTWNLELYEQFYKRVWRQGNKASHVFNYHIIAKNTVDEAVMLALGKKAFTQNALLAALKDYAVDKRNVWCNVKGRR